MHQDGYVAMIDDATKFHNSLTIRGWFHHPDDQLISVSLGGVHALGQVQTIGAPVPASADFALKHQPFRLQLLTSTEPVLLLDHDLEMHTADGQSVSFSLAELITERQAHGPGSGLYQRFTELVEGLDNARILEVGGRDRSASGTIRTFGKHPVIVLDVVPADGVDVVGDAHALSEIFPPDHFDAFLAASVFEHLAMPWRVVTELNRVLKLGGVGHVSSHQTIGLHDAPWDFWRFSDAAWDALFNNRTGFEIVERAMDQPQYILPHICRPGKEDAEQAIGFELSSVTVRKTGRTNLSWPVRVEEIINSHYPVT